MKIKIIPQSWIAVAEAGKLKFDARPSWLLCDPTAFPQTRWRQ